MLRDRLRMDLVAVMKCQYCAEEIVRLTPEIAAIAGLNVRDFDWVHIYADIYNPYCDNGYYDEDKSVWHDPDWATRFCPRRTATHEQHRKRFGWAATHPRRRNRRDGVRHR